MRPDSAVADSPSPLIPNFCGGRAVLSLAFAMELFAICFTLAAGTQDEVVIQRLVLLSVYLQWIGLCCAATLCWLRSALRQVPPAYLFATCWAAMVLIVLVLAQAAWLLGAYARFDVGLNQESQAEFVLRHTLLAAIVSLLVLRYFWARHQWMEQVRLQSEARYQALTARIRPHFLFNALNSLAALIRLHPQQAETMVEDLAEVFRASLEDRGQMSTLAEELTICRAYLRIEKARLGDKLELVWDVPEAFAQWPLPMLTVQPLVENAVYHGVSRLREAGDIRIRASQERGDLLLEVSNLLPPADDAGRSGHRIALDNIASRLNLLYGSGAQLQTLQEQGRYCARLRLPKSAPEMP